MRISGVRSEAIAKWKIQDSRFRASENTRISL